MEQYRGNNPDAYEVVRGDILYIPEDGRFDGIYNLGVIEHFETADILQMLTSFRGALRREGKLVMFWPHMWATSVLGLKFVGALTGRKYHPDEVSLCRGRAYTREFLMAAGWWLKSYKFGAGDGFIQAVVVASPI